MPSLTSEPKPSYFNVEASSGVLQGTRTPPYLSVLLVGAMATAFHPETDRNTANVLRNIADDLDTYWADWDAYNNAKDPSAGVPLED